MRVEALWPQGQLVRRGALHAPFSHAMLPPLPCTRALAPRARGAPYWGSRHPRCVQPHGSLANAPSPLNLHASFLSEAPHCAAGLDANRKQNLGTPLAVAAMLNAAAFAFSAAAWQRAGASAAATFLRATLPALPAIGFPAQLAASACLTQPWGAGLGDAGGVGLGDVGAVLGLGDGPGDGVGLAPGAVGDGLGLTPGAVGDGLGAPALGGEGLGPGAGLGDGTGLTPGADVAARGSGGGAGDWALLVVATPCLDRARAVSARERSAVAEVRSRVPGARQGALAAHPGTRRPCRSPGHWHWCTTRRWRRMCACTRPWWCCSWALASRTGP
jgi:hypothetical protein